MDTDPSFDYWRKLFPALFPDLKEGTTFYFTSPADPKYNCLAWALSCNTQTFDNHVGCSWAWKEIPSDTAEGWATFCERHGFVRVLGNNIEFLPGIEKIAILEKDGELHAARQDGSGLWKSKMGEIGPDIDHTDLTSLRSVYGEVVHVLQRDRP